MKYEPMNMIFSCPVCDEHLTRYAVTQSIPEAIRPSRNPLGLTLQRLADYDINVVLTRYGIQIEQPRASLRET